jgi:hypothetical protein
MGLAQSRVCKLQIASNPMFGARRLSLNRDTESVVALTPNIRLAVGRSSCWPLRPLLLARRSSGLPLAQATAAPPSRASTLLPQLGSRSSVRIHAARDFCQTLFMAVNHPNHRDDPTHDDGRDGNQQSAQTQDRLDEPVHSPASRLADQSASDCLPIFWWS